MSFIQGMQGCRSIQKSVSIIQHINSIKDKNHNHLNRHRKKFLTKIQHPFKKKPHTKKTRNKNFFNLVRDIY